MFIYSDLDLADPESYYGGFKEGRVMRWGTATRALSDMWSGDWQGSQFNVTISDYDRSIRRRLNSATERYWTKPLTVRMTNRANRALLGAPYTVFNGVILEAQPARELAFDLTLGDFVGSRILTDQAMIPWRLVRDGFLDQLDEIAEGLDRDMPEPIIYGRHLRIPDETPPVGAGFVYTPQYLGIMDGEHVWLVAGHACADAGPLYIDGEESGEGAGFRIPGQSAPKFVDLASSTFGTMRRYCLLYGTVGSEIPDEVAAGDRELTLAVEGIEPNGDGTGTVITDRFRQYKHFLINYVAHRGQESYQSGDYLENPEWEIQFEDDPILLVDEASFDEAEAIGLSCLDDGYIGAAIIGARSGDRASVRRWISDWNRSCRARFGITRYGQMRIVLLHPTEAAKAAAPLYTDAYEILEGSFTTAVGWSDHANVLPWRCDFEHESGQWKTNDVYKDDTSIADYRREIPSDIREYPFAPGITHGNHLAVLEGRVRTHPRRRVTIDGTVGPDPVTLDSLGYRELGDYIRYTHYAAVGEPAEIRLAQVESIQVSPGTRKVQIVAFDCEDLIAFDAPDDGSPA
jgi:hypothetical protein